MDDSTTVAQLKQTIQAFRDEREWAQFHDPKNVAETISVEAGELLEHFLWKDKAGVIAYLQNEKNKEEIADELADVLHGVLLMSLTAGIDLVTATENKLRKTRLKYPIEKSKGNSTKWNKL